MSRRHPGKVTEVRRVEVAQLILLKTMIDIVPVHVQTIVTAMKISLPLRKKIVQDLCHPKDWQNDGLIAVRRMKMDNMRIAIRQRAHGFQLGSWMLTCIKDLSIAAGIIKGDFRCFPRGKEVYYTESLLGGMGLKGDARPDMWERAG